MSSVTLPATILTSEPNSFARRTFETRIPRIVLDVIAANDYPAALVSALRALRKEILSGKVRLLRENAQDRAFWDEHAREHLGKSWLDVPWYWAEAYFYRRVLEAVRYFQPGNFYEHDPYASAKRGELVPERAPRTLSAILEHLPPEPAQAFSLLLHASLWGNRTDLSYLEILDDARRPFSIEQERANILVDDSARVWEHLQANLHRDIDIICDNAGTELLLDLALTDFLLQTGIANQVTLHGKPQPFFVSDAMSKDILESMDVLGRSTEIPLRQLTSRLAHAMSAGRLILLDHPFWVTGLFFHSMPSDLSAILARSSLVVSKGDANYRRLIGDCHWPPTTSFQSAVGYFPTSVLALRTLKAELIVGLGEGEPERLHAQDPAWQINGKRGLVQFRE